MSVLTRVTTHFCGIHTGPFADKPHGHTWEVTAWFRQGRDARMLQELVRGHVQPLDHTSLDDHGLATDEAIAGWLGTTLSDRDCVRVSVRRPLEGMGAEWSL